MKAAANDAVKLGEVAYLMQGVVTNKGIREIQFDVVILREGNINFSVGKLLSNEDFPNIGDDLEWLQIGHGGDHITHHAGSARHVAAGSNDGNALSLGWRLQLEGIQDFVVGARKGVWLVFRFSPMERGDGGQVSKGQLVTKLVNPVRGTAADSGESDVTSIQHGLGLHPFHEISGRKASDCTHGVALLGDSEKKCEYLVGLLSRQGWDGDHGGMVTNIRIIKDRTRSNSLLHTALEIGASRNRGGQNAYTFTTSEPIAPGSDKGRGFKSDRVSTDYNVSWGGETGDTLRQVYFLEIGGWLKSALTVPSLGALAQVDSELIKNPNHWLDQIDLLLPVNDLVDNDGPMPLEVVGLSLTELFPKNDSSSQDIES